MFGNARPFPWQPLSQTSTVVVACGYQIQFPCLMTHIRRGLFLRLSHPDCYILLFFLFKNSSYLFYYTPLIQFPLSSQVTQEKKKSMSLGLCLVHVEWLQVDTAVGRKKKKNSPRVRKYSKIRQNISQKKLKGQQRHNVL